MTPGGFCASRAIRGLGPRLTLLSKAPRGIILHLEHAMPKVSIYMTDDLLGQLDGLVEELGTSRSKVVSTTMEFVLAPEAQRKAPLNAFLNRVKAAARELDDEPAQAPAAHVEYTGQRPGIQVFENGIGYRFKKTGPVLVEDPVASARFRDRATRNPANWSWEEAAE